MKRFSALCVGLLAAFGSQAATLSFSFNNALQPTEIAQSGALGLFDTSLGTLTAATLTVTGAANTVITLTNNAQQSQLVQATGTVDLLYGSSLASINTILAGIGFPQLTMPTGIQNIAAGGTFLSPLLADTDTDSANVFGAAGLAVAGGGNFNVTCQSLSGIGISGGGGQIASNQTTNAGCGAEIVYTYTVNPPTQTPEPSSLALIGLALAGFGASRKARRA